MAASAHHAGQIREKATMVVIALNTTHHKEDVFTTSHEIPRPMGTRATRSLRHQRDDSSKDF
jgi:hypothetical protein